MGFWVIADRDFPSRPLVAPITKTFVAKTVHMLGGESEDSRANPPVTHAHAQNEKNMTNSSASDVIADSEICRLHSEVGHVTTWTRKGNRTTILS